MKDLTDMALLVKYKNAGMSDAVIASKLGLKEAQVREKWLELLQLSETASSAGYLDLSQQFTIMAHQYQLLGESMKIIATALSDRMGMDEIKGLITSDPKQTLKNLWESSIILKPFVAVDVNKSFEESRKRDAEGN